MTTDFSNIQRFGAYQPHRLCCQYGLKFYISMTTRSRNRSTNRSDSQISRPQLLEEVTGMKRKPFLVVVFALLASSAFAASPKPVVVYTFTCNGSVFWRIGPCPNGGTPYSLLQGLDGNFYGNAQVSSEGR